MISSWQSIILSDQGATVTNATVSRSFTGLDSVRFPYHRVVEDVRPGLEFEAHRKVRRVDEGTISSMPGSLPAKLKVGTASQACPVD